MLEKYGLIHKELVVYALLRFSDLTLTELQYYGQLREKEVVEATKGLEKKKGCTFTVTAQGKEELYSLREAKDA